MQTIEYNSSTDVISPALVLVANVLLIYPLLYLTLIYAHWALTWFELGHPPSMYENASLLGCNNSIQLMLIGLMLGLLPAFTCGFITNFVYLLRRERCDLYTKLRTALFVTVWVLTMLLINVDPGSIFQWSSEN